MFRPPQRPGVFGSRERAVLIVVAVVIVLIYTSYSLFRPGVSTTQNDDEQVVVKKKKLIEADVAVFSTDLGNIAFRLLPDAAPLTVDNFKTLIDKGAYSPGCFYRAEDNFVLQGGLDSSRKLDFQVPSVKNEYKYPNKPRSVSMARGGDPDSATSEFAIQVGDNSKWLGPGGADKWGYTVFAEVIEGWDVVEAIMTRPVDKRGGLQYLQQNVCFNTKLERRTIEE